MSDTAQNHARGSAIMAIAGLLVALATMLGAFGTHGLKPILTPARFESFETAVQYQFFHSLGLLMIGLLLRERVSALLNWSAGLILIGLALFCGSIYALTFGAPKVFGMVAPFGGISLMAAWICFALALWRTRFSPDRA